MHQSLKGQSNCFQFSRSEDLHVVMLEAAQKLAVESWLLFLRLWSLQGRQYFQKPYSGIHFPDLRRIRASHKSCCHRRNEWWIFSHGEKSSREQLSGWKWGHSSRRYGHGSRNVSAGVTCSCVWTSLWGMCVCVYRYVGHSHWTVRLIMWHWF